MRVRQRVEFIVKSDRLTPPEITATVGVEPDEAKAKGERRGGAAPSPRCHLWALRSEKPAASTVEEHLDALLPRLRESADGLRAVLANPGTEGWLVVDRMFEEGEELFDEATHGLDRPSDAIRLSGQHPFLGWGLDKEVIALLAAVGAGLDVDEYG